MKRVLLVSLVILFLGACSNLHLGLPTTPGAFINAPSGKEFVPVIPVDPRDAIVYVYRPRSPWGDAEVQAPSFFINDDQIFGLKSGAYSWIELPPGDYDFYARRPLSILYLKTIFDVTLHVEGGEVYFFRYSELHPLDMERRVNNPEDYLSAVPLQQVPADIGEQEIQHLKLDEPGVFYGGGETEPRWAPFYTYPADNAGSVPDSLIKQPLF